VILLFAFQTEKGLKQYTNDAVYGLRNPASPEFIFQSQALNSLKGLPLYPSFLQTALQPLPHGIEHIVHIDYKQRRI
jgi:hypothetical protein